MRTSQPEMALRIAGVAVAALLTGLLTAAPAAADVQVAAEPSAVSPGQSSTVTAGCGTDATAATLNADLFGGSAQVGMVRAPSSGSGAFTAEVSVPESAVPGTYDLSVWCSTGESGTGWLIVAPTGAPSTGDGSTAPAGRRGQLLGGGLLIVLAVAGLLLMRRQTDAS
jgi:hypothetical protein